MSDEKTIICETPVFSWNTKTKQFFVLGHKFDGVNSIEDFINFIYDLQQENQQLKEQTKLLSAKKPIKDLKERNDQLMEQYRLRDIRTIHLEQQLKQRDEVIDKIGKIIDTTNCRYMINGKVYVNSFCLSDLYKIINKYKGG